MKKLWSHASICASLVIFAFACTKSVRTPEMTAAGPPTAAQSTHQQPPVTCAQAGSSAKPVVLPTSLDSTCAQIPYAPAMGKSAEGGMVTNQQAADLYSWLSFVALNWPVNPATCTPDASQNILQNPNSPTWMSYLTSDEVFKAAGAPNPWCGGQQVAAPHAPNAMRQARLALLPAAVRSQALAHPEIGLFLSHSAKSSELVRGNPLLMQNAPPRLTEILQSTGLPIVDQNGRFARYSVSMNRDEYDLINNNMLYTKAGQEKYGNVIFPVSDQSQGVMGALELKAAWKVMGKGDDPTRFFTQQALVYNEEDTSGKSGSIVTVGLIGLHILHKSQGQPNWVWSTFEQVDNDTTSFFNANCQAPSPNPNNHCIPNQPTADKNAVEFGPHGETQFPTQIVQKPYITITNPDYGKAFQALLAGTPWANYKLISTQWSSGATGVVPQYMAASVQETFVPQHTKDGHVLDGCFSCHAGAKNVANKTTEFSFMLLNARQ